MFFYVFFCNIIEVNIFCIFYYIITFNFFNKNLLFLQCIIIYPLNIEKAKKLKVKDLRELVHESFYKRIDRKAIIPIIKKDSYCLLGKVKKRFNIICY